MHADIIRKMEPWPLTDISSTSHRGISLLLSEIQRCIALRLVDKGQPSGPTVPGPVIPLYECPTRSVYDVALELVINPVVILAEPVAFQEGTTNKSFFVRVVIVVPDSIVDHLVRTYYIR